MILRAVDLETSGEPPDAEICEIGWTDIEDGGAIDKPQSSLVRITKPMPPGARGIHHISFEDCETRGVMPEEARHMLGTPDAFVAHVARFEQAFFDGNGRPFICTYKLAMRLAPRAPDFKLQTLRYWLKLDDEDDFDPCYARPPHRAGPDSYIGAFVARRIMRKVSFEDAVKWSAEPALLPVCQFKKYRGLPWEEVPTDFLDWMVTKATDMGEDELFTARHWLKHHADNKWGKHAADDTDR